jgi:hypothetical protein
MPAIMKRDGADISSPEALLADTNIHHLMTRRDMMLTASMGAAELALSKDLKPPHSSSWLLDPLPFVGEYNRAPGELLVHPESLIDKSPSDPRAYRALTLPNGLRVLLASDPDAPFAAAALNVHVGHHADPDDLPGLAHLAEHMLFLGNERFPEPGDLERFLSAHGGASNALTTGEDTRYYFDVADDALRPALERFAALFATPLFDPDALARELGAIDSEHAKDSHFDADRLSQVCARRARHTRTIAA